MLKYLTAGESHGKLITGILDGFPAGVSIPKEFICGQLRRRRLALGRSPRQKSESDDIIITGGWHNGCTTGAPIGVLLRNAVRNKPQPSGVLRTCHADSGGMVKYGLKDAGLVRERASARETAARMALFSFPVFLCNELGINFSSCVYSLGGREVSSPEEAEKIIAASQAAGDTAGGSFRLEISGVPAGLGSYAQGSRRMFSALAAELAAIPAVKSVSCGVPDLAAMPGTAMAAEPGSCGGIDGGISSGGKILLHCSVKPVPGTKTAVPARDLHAGQIVSSSSSTSDITAVYAAAVIAEGAAAFVIADLILEKFGGDSFAELSGRLAQWRKEIR